MHHLNSKILAIVVVERNKVHVFSLKTHFQLIFYKKTLVKHHMNLVKSIQSLKNTKQNLKIKNQPKTKKLRSSYMFFRHFQGKQVPSSNSSNYIELFNTKIDCFSGWNRCQ